jgi:large subunit ribosomal protein L28
MAINRSRCYSCGKGFVFGNSRSHSNIRTRRVWKPNLQVVRVLAGGKIVKVKVCTSCLSAGKVRRAPRGQRVA